MNIKTFKKKLASFTIIELVITMIITTIVISICYYTYLILDQQFTKYRKRSEAVNEYYLFSYALQRDAERSDGIKTTIDNSDILFSNDDTLIVYSFQSNFVTRDINGKQDTFKIKAIIDSLPMVSDSLRLINSIFIQTEQGADHIHFFIKKYYSAQQLMKAERNQNEQLN
jgi:type II secretory pathway pseudopilin PulG